MENNINGIMEDDRLQKIEQSIEALQKQQNKMYNFLIGDEYHIDGIKNRIENLERKDKTRQRYWWYMVGGVTVIIFLLKWGDELVKLI